MEVINQIVSFWNANAATIAAVLGALLAMSEAMAQIESVKANSVFQAITNGIKFILKNVFKKEV